MLQEELKKFIDTDLHASQGSLLRHEASLVGDKLNNVTDDEVQENFAPAEDALHLSLLPFSLPTSPPLPLPLPLSSSSPPSQLAPLPNEEDEDQKCCCTDTKSKQDPDNVFDVLVCIDTCFMQKHNRQKTQDSPRDHLDTVFIPESEA
ncbi:hypothetical protein GYMLUDRAFT_246065 [Collybiopsis luxurians FD-317 M1]|uniref:Uncharacterized protein n=1 Tax=Collybiopsis luxurians FD-317 M1 TaxID=944289 RepID=A0A0D0CJ34_9AGAR|nr:hypothetical protein GYMLUDRAFT_246065 [Collybiopsis luxurians FD-317 M1]